MILHEILPLTNDKGKNIPTTIFPVAKEHIKYLGIRIGKTPASLYNLKITTLIDKVIRELQAGKNLPLSLFGRTHYFKINSFAKLLYPLQTIPLLIR